MSREKGLRQGTAIDKTTMQCQPCCCSGIQRMCLVHRQPLHESTLPDNKRLDGSVEILASERCTKNYRLQLFRLAKLLSHLGTRAE